MIPLTGSNINCQVSPIAIGEIKTGMTIKVRNTPTMRARVSSIIAKTNPRVICMETTQIHQISVRRILFQNVSSVRRYLKFLNPTHFPISGRNKFSTLNARVPAQPRGKIARPTRITRVGSTRNSATRPSLSRLTGGGTKS